MPQPLIINVNGQELMLPVDFSKLPSGTFPMSYFDDNFRYIVQNVLYIFGALPTVIPQTPLTLWNNGGVISITPPAPYPNEA